MHTHTPPPDDKRRSFLKLATHGLGALFGVIFGAPAVAYLLDPRNRPNPPGDLRPVHGVRLGDVGDVPVQGVIRNVRRDAWTLYPDDILGRVWVRRVRPGTEKDCFQVFSTVCPHLGCAVNCNPPGQESGFTCPCHDGRFDLDGTKKPDEPGHANAPPRGMDTLEFDVDPTDRDLLLVKYEFYKQGVPEKVRRA